MCIQFDSDLHAHCLATHHREMLATAENARLVRECRAAHVQARLPQDLRAGSGAPVFLLRPARRVGSFMRQCAQAILF